MYIAISSLPSSSKEHSEVFNLFGIVLSAYLSAGILKIVLSYFDGKILPLSDLFTQVKYFWRILGANILIGLIVFAGIILLIVPGIIWGLKYQFTLNLIVDKDMGISEAMQKSAELTKGVKLQLLGLNLTLVGVMILGFLALGIGILVAVPIVWLADVYVYKKLLKAHKTEAPIKEEATA